MSPFELRWQNTACFSGSIDKARVGQKGDAYFVNYPPGSNNRRMLQFHIERGNSREPRYCMRIYYETMRDYLSSVNLQKNRFFKKCRLGDLKNAFVLLLFEVI